MIFPKGNLWLRVRLLWGLSARDRRIAADYYVGGLPEADIIRKYGITETEFDRLRERLRRAYATTRPGRSD